jgi:hypothetical protein
MASVIGPSTRWRAVAADLHVDSAAVVGAGVEQVGLARDGLHKGDVEGSSSRSQPRPPSRLPTIGRRGAVAAGLLQATSLPFLVTAVAIGLELGEFTPETGAALVSAGLLSVIVFPIVSLGLLRKGPGATEPATEAPPGHPSMEGTVRLLRSGR